MLSPCCRTIPTLLKRVSRPRRQLQQLQSLNKPTQQLSPPPLHRLLQSLIPPRQPHLPSRNRPLLLLLLLLITIQQQQPPVPNHPCPRPFLPMRPHRLPRHHSRQMPMDLHRLIRMARRRTAVMRVSLSCNSTPDALSAARRILGLWFGTLPMVTRTLKRRVGSFVV